MNKAIFFDRDGVINELILNPKTNEYESPHEPKELKLISDSLDSIKKLQNAGYFVFIVSNQPSFAKGKTTLDKIEKIHSNLLARASKYGITFKECYYCYHHPLGIVSEYSGECKCRKPKPYFINKAKKDYGLDLNNSWMIGDQDSDIECGKNAGVKTLLILNKHSSSKRGFISPDYSINKLSESINIILKNENSK